MSNSTGNKAPAANTLSATILVNVKDIKGHQLPNVGILNRFDKFYVDLMIDGHLKHTTATAKGNTASWTESFYFDALGSSMFECRIYAKHKIGRQEVIGETKDAIESLLTEGAAGVVTRELYKHDAYGNQRKTQIIIEFTIMAISKASDADAAVLNMKDAIAEGKNALDLIDPAPSLLGPIQGAVDVSATVISNTKSMSNTWAPLLQKIKLFNELVGVIAEIHPYFNMAWSILSTIPKSILAQVDRDDSIVRLVESMDDVYSFVKEAELIKKIESHGRIILLMAQQTTECAYFIRDYAMNKNFWKRALKNSFMSNVDNKINQYADKFNELKMAFQDRAVLQTGITVSRIFDNIENLAVDFDLSDMPYAKGARFDPDKGCLPGTREQIIGEIVQWVNRANSDTVPRIFFLSAVAGYGKSAVAHAVARQFDKLGRLGSSYCFDRADQTNRHPQNLFSTIALDIADLDHHWKKSLCDVVKSNRSLRTTRSATEQFQNFILEPAKALTTIGPIVIVIDAFDESGDSSYRRTLLEVLARRAADLPNNFRILITARPETDILKAISNNKSVFYRHLDNIDKSSNEHDISLFIETMLSGIPSLELEWPNKDWCRMLLKASDGLFQWASTACRAIKDGEGGVWPTELLTRFCSLTRGLDGLYSEVLSRSFNPNDAIAMSRFKSIMGRILVVKEPLSVSAHSDMCCGSNDAELVRLVTQSMGSLLSGVNQDNAPVRALHVSFFEFLADENRSKSYYVDAPQQNWSLTLSTFRVMKRELRFNICSLETSHLRNTDVPDLTTRVENTILPRLSYGCRFWAGHLIATAYDATILYELQDFLHHRLLYWLEVLSLIKNINVASGMLLSLQEWNQDRNDDVVSYANDAIKFVSVFGAPISHSAPHIYLSALPFAPKNSRVAKQYLPLFPKTLDLQTGKAEDWPAIIGVFEGHTNVVHSVAFSQDGKRIVSGSWDQTIRVWDAETEEVLVGPLEGHTNWVNSVAFSQDGKRIVSGSYDQTIRVWDVGTGEVLVGPLKGHTHFVKTVAFSQDGKCIVSGSHDHTIRVWDAETGDVLVGPLEGHTGSVASVSFSHDGKRIVSGSWDRAIRVWDAESGEVLVGPLEGHTHFVNSVAFSQDGKRIVSGSWDHTIRVWEAETGEVLVGPVEGHTHFVNSVAFSRDGKHIVSGSSDQTVRIWDAETGKVVVGPLEGHTGPVESVTFSHDGKRVVSGSSDRTIRVWDAMTRHVVARPLEVHTNWVDSVAFSQDGKRIVSGSFDQTIRLWDAETGDIVVGPLKGHTHFVKSVAFSQDGKHIVSGSYDRTIRVWDAETGEALVGPLKGHSGEVASVAFSHDGKRIVSGSWDQTIRVWDTDTGEVLVGPLEEHTDCVYSVTFSQNSRRIVSGSSDQTICIWDAETGGVLVGPLEGHTGPVESVAFSQDSKYIVSGSYDQTIRVWDAETGQVLVGPLRGHTHFVHSVAFSQDGKCIVSGSSDQSIRVWDAENGKVLVGPLEGHTGSVLSVAFSHDSKRIVSGSSDQTIRVFSFIDDDLRNDFNDRSRLTHGWILNSATTLLLWVPSWNRAGLFWPRSSLVIGSGIRTQLDLHNFVHGDSWQECKT